ncbi:LytTR family transcriptional regulator DNA-binding domain-containing protein [Enterococcus ratti]|uniref:LytTR family transcriptional regulator DNA-binding domain-containing protein n=1 Tax=Enterococcus ratti TaxID=150033 RepID=UPI003515FE26
MKIYYIEDNLFHQQLFLNERMNYSNLRSIPVEIFPINQLEQIYKNLASFPFSAADIFLIDIDLQTFHSGIDFAKKIREINPECCIIFLSNDTSKGLEIINQHIRPDLYLSKNEMKTVFTKLEKLITTKLKKQDDTDAIIELKGSLKVYFIHPDEINYIVTVKGFRSSLEFFGISENFIIQDKMKHVKQLFEPYKYFNALKSFSINPYNIKEVNKQTLEVIFKNDDTLLLSASSIKKLLTYIDQL